MPSGVHTSSLKSFADSSQQMLHAALCSRSGNTGIQSSFGADQKSSSAHSNEDVFAILSPPPLNVFDTTAATFRFALSQSRLVWTAKELAPPASSNSRSASSASDHRFNPANARARLCNTFTSIEPAVRSARAASAHVSADIQSRKRR